jgi:AcrR family transcriptional regulator
MPAVNSPKTRARPLSPEDRRAAILDAVIPLLIERGAAVTTAEMAEAAGIAEGTIFRVFPDKASLLHAAVERTLDPSPFDADLSAIDPALPLADRLEAAADILAGRFEGMTALIGMLRSIPHDDQPHVEMHRTATESMAAVIDSLTRLLEPHRDRLNVEPSRAAVFLRGLVFTNGHPLLAVPGRMSSAQLVEVLLNGITRDGR